MLAIVVFGVDTVPGIAALVVAAAMLGTALVKWCPISRLLGIDTCPKPKVRDMRTATSR